MSHDTKYIEPHTESDAQHFEKTVTAGTNNDDVALKVFTDVHALADEIDPHAEKKLVRKIDFYVIPFICITYLITYIDKATLGYGNDNLLRPFWV